MTSTTEPPASCPVFARCVRCDYSLQGLPANYACPECGLRYDEQCAIYRPSNPKQILLVWFAILGGGWVVLRNLQHVGNFPAANAWQKAGAVAALIWLPCVAATAWYLVRRYRRGFLLAVTGDGLIIRLPGFTDDVVRWERVEQVAIKDVRPGRPQVASISLASPKKTLEIGSVCNVFPKRADVERFVEQVRRRAGAARAPLVRSDEPAPSVTRPSSDP